ncbi:hypothetical protein [Pseudomonas saxonica]|uniref:Uncharacterized protein n=1 Tax=Pseudomonas saxonica TaxID=2600598 RepID=A0A5C5PQY4_9PSED|nr:hypothetical protein [Pseudomonas saxonica]TWR81662.1 hypothetical protein FJD37_22285 [Pseudomonas saxonica]
MAIKISGAPRQFDENELKARQAKHHHMYRETSACTQLIRGGHPLDLFQRVVTAAKSGLEIAAKYPVSLEPMAYSLYMMKSVEEQESDLAAIDAEVRIAYIEELKQEHADYQERLYAQLVESEERKQQEKAETAKQKVLTELRKQSMSCYSQLQIPES